MSIVRIVLTASPVIAALFAAMLTMAQRMGPISAVIVLDTSGSMTEKLPMIVSGVSALIAGAPHVDFALVRTDDAPELGSRSVMLPTAS